MKIKLIIAMSILLLATGCGDRKNLNGQYVKTADGRVFQVIHNLGDNYFLRAVDVEQIKNLTEQTEFVTEKKQ